MQRTCHNNSIRPTGNIAWRRYKRSEARYVLPELRRSIVEVECDPNEGLKFDDDDEDDEDDDDEVRLDRFW